jgi:AraC-like DNA-binding protein
MAAALADRSLSDARDRLASGDDATHPGLREEIAASWRRSVDSGVRPDRFEVLFRPDLDTDGKLSRAALPILDHIADDLPATGVGVVLTNERAEVLYRRAADANILAQLDRIMLAPGFCYSENRVGTNAIGTALEMRSASMVLGAEHFAETLGVVACAAVPIEDPRTGRTIGILDITCEAKDANPLMLPFVRNAVWEVEQRLLDRTLFAERVLQEHFLRARRQATGPLVSLSRDSMLTNGAAAGLLQSSDRALLWETVQRGLTNGPEVSELCLASGMSIIACFEVVRDGAEVVGALVRFEPSRGPNVTSGGPLSARDIRTVTEYIDAHLAEHLSLSELARIVSLSQYHFARSFREATGTTPHRFVTDRRVARAECLLRSSAMPISLVASACGFSDQSHLTRVFQQRLRATPRAVRLGASR